MPQELDRIKHLAGLQQEAPAKKKLKYSSSQYAQALSQLQLRNHKGELHTITPKQQQKIIDIIEQHGFGVELQNYLHKINVINKYAAVSEAPAAGDQALAKDLANHFMNKANEFKKSGDTGPEYEEMVDIAKAFQQGQDQGMEEINDLANFEFSAHPFGGKFSNNEGEPEDEVLAILNKHGYSFTEKSHPERPNRGLVTLIKKDAKESAVQEAPGAEINNSTMPTELNRIKELAGLQQEAAVGLTAQQKQGLDAINAKYGKYIGYGNGGSLPVEAMERAIDPGSTLWADDKEENELKAYMKKMGYKDLSDMESKDEEYVDNVRLPISDAMADDLQKVLGDYNDNSGLAQAAKDYLGSLGETAVAEAPASGDQALANELSSYFAKLAKEMLQNMQRPNTNDVEYEEFVDIAQAFKGGIQAGLDEVNLSGFEFSSNPFGDFGRSINDGPDEELVKILAKYGYRPGPDGDNDEATIVKQQEESSVQPMPVLNAVKETPAMSQVDEAIKKATAQLKSFSNFDGLKPYKPKKK